MGIEQCKIEPRSTDQGTYGVAGTVFLDPILGNSMGIHIRSKLELITFFHSCKIFRQRPYTQTLKMLSNET